MLLSKYKKKKKFLLDRKKKWAGRNNTGRVTVAHQGGGHKQLYRNINFVEQFDNGIVVNLEYDPNRTAKIAKIYTKDNKNNMKFNYILAPQNLKILDIISSSQTPFFLNNDILSQKQVGSFYLLSDLLVGDLVYNIELFPNKGGRYVRSAGTFAEILNKTEEHVTVKMPSGEQRMFYAECRACLGSVSNENHFHTVVGKAGKSRWLNKRPTVRGVAMNPIDHPHGGNTCGGIQPKTPWARLTKGIPTRSSKKKNKLILKYYKNRNTIKQ